MVARRLAENRRQRAADRGRRQRRCPKRDWRCPMASEPR